MEKTPIDRLFNSNPLEKEDINPIVKTINDVISIVNTQQKLIIEMKASIETLTKKVGENSSLLINITNKIDDVNNANASAISSLNNYQFPTPPYQQYNQQHPVIPNNRNNIPMVQPKSSNNGTLGFDPMSVSVPNTNVQGDSTSNVTPQQMAAIRNQIANRQIRQ